MTLRDVIERDQITQEEAAAMMRHGFEMVWMAHALLTEIMFPAGRKPLPRFPKR